MNARAKFAEPEPVVVESTAVALVTANPALVVLDTDKFDAFYEAVRRETETHVPDVTTAKGREAIAALAFKVTKSKTALDAAGKKLTEDARAQINLVDAARRNIREKLDALRDEIRRPLTEWEIAEEARLERVGAMLGNLRDSAVVLMSETSEALALRVTGLRAMVIDDAEFQESAEVARSLLATAISTLDAAVIRITKEEADRAELERLRAEQAERERQEEIRRATEAAERQAAERREQEERERAEAEQRREAAREAEQQRLAEAAERARLDAERKAQEDLAAAEASHRAEVQRLEKEKADAIAKGIADAAAIEAENKRQADEQKARDENRAHRTKVLSETKQAIMQCGVEEPVAKTIVLAIVAGQIPHTSLRF